MSALKMRVGKISLLLNLPLWPAKISTAGLLKAAAAVVLSALLSQARRDFLTILSNVLLLGGGLYATRARDPIPIRLD
jgi:hypothetical protein